MLSTGISAKLDQVISSSLSPAEYPGSFSSASAEARLRQSDARVDGRWSMAVCLGRNTKHDLLRALFLQCLSLMFGTHEIETFSLDTSSRWGIAGFHLDMAGELGVTELTKQVQCLTGGPEVFSNGSTILHIRCYLGHVGGDLSAFARWLMSNYEQGR